MVHQCHSCQVRQLLGAYPGVEGHDVQQGFLRKPKDWSVNLEALITLDNPRDNAPQSFAYRIIRINLIAIDRQKLTFNFAISVFNVCKNSPAVLWVTSCWSKRFRIPGKSV